MKRWQQWQQQFLAISAQRRKFWLGLGVVMLTYVTLWWIVLPLQQQLAETQATQRQQRFELGIYEQELSVLQQRLAGDPKAELRSQRGQLQQQLAALDTQLSGTSHYVSAADNRHLLKALLDAAHGIKVQAAQALPPELAYQDPIDAKATIYKHRLQFTVRGDFFALRDYLESLEQLPWNFYWQQMDYRVLQAPTAEVTFEIFTLSMERGYVAS